MPKKKESLTFPLIKNKEIIACMKELAIPLSMDELKNPSFKRMKEVYEGFLMHLMQISREELRMPLFNAVDVFEYPELHEDSVAEFSLSFFMLRLMHAVGLQTASLRDIFFPDYPKTKRMLSALINFARFRGERLSTYHEFCAQTEELREVCQKVSSDNEELKENLANLKRQREEDAPIIEKLQKETKTMADTIGELNKKHGSLRAQIKTIKKEVGEVQDKVSTCKFEKLNLKEGNEQLKRQIVKSPERLRKALSDMTSSIEVNKEELQVRTEKMRGLQKKVDLLNKIKNKLDKRIGKMEEISVLMKNSKNLQREIKEGMSENSENKEKIQSLNMNTDHIGGQIGEYQSKLYELQGQFDQKRQEANKLLNEAMRKKMDMMRMGAQEKAKLEHNNMIYKMKKHEMELSKKAHDQKMRYWQGSYTKLMKTVKDYHEHIRQTMEASI